MSDYFPLIDEEDIAFARTLCTRTDPLATHEREVGRRLVAGLGVLMAAIRAWGPDDPLTQAIGAQVASDGEEGVRLFREMGWRPLPERIVSGAEVWLRKTN